MVYLFFVLVKLLIRFFVELVFFTKFKQSEHSVIQGLLEVLDYLIGDKSQGPTVKKLKKQLLNPFRTSA